MNNAGYGLILNANGGNLAVSNTISGSGTVSKQGANTLTLSGTNTFSGQLTVNNGYLSISTINNDSANGVLGNSALSVGLGNPTNSVVGTLQYTGSTVSSTKKFTMNVGTGGSGGAFQIDSAATNLTLSGAIDGSGTLAKTGAGTLTLSGANIYTGATSISAGILKLGAVGALGNGTLNTSSVTVSNLAALDLNGITPT